MSEIIYLSLDEIIAIHFDQISRYGGTHGIRDLDLILSAVSRPRASFGGVDLYKSLFDKAAALLHSLNLNHPFLDGNKRTAIVSCARFLFINGFELNINNYDLVDLSLKIANKKMPIEKISSWLKKHSKVC